MGIIIQIAKSVLKAIYAIFKLFKTKNKITFLSRQANEPSIDFKFLAEELNEKNKNVQIVMLTKRIESGIKAKIGYAFHIFKQLYHVATSKIVILDGYQIVVSVLNHKKGLKVIQLWHALGSLKKFGYSISDKGEGSKKEIIQKMNMHRNYDIVLSSSKVAKNNFAEAFNIKKNKVVIMGLPRIDFLQSEYWKQITVDKITSNYPNLKNNKQNIVYVPTFRKNTQDDIRVKDIINRVDYNKYNLIVKLHHDKEDIYIDGKDKKTSGNIATGMEFLHIADYVITDYSAITFEALIAGKPVYYYVYDYENYKNTRDMYIDFKNEMPGVISENPDEILQAIRENVRFENKEKEFINKYVSTCDKNNTAELTKYILNMI